MSWPYDRGGSLRLLRARTNRELDLRPSQIALGAIRRLLGLAGLSITTQTGSTGQSVWPASLDRRRSSQRFTRGCNVSRLEGRVVTKTHPSRRSAHWVVVQWRGLDLGGRTSRMFLTRPNTAKTRARSRGLSLEMSPSMGVPKTRSSISGSGLAIHPESLRAEG